MTDSDTPAQDATTMNLFHALAQVLPKPIDYRLLAEILSVIEKHAATPAPQPSDAPHNGAEIKRMTALLLGRSINRTVSGWECHLCGFYTHGHDRSSTHANHKAECPAAWAAAYIRAHLTGEAQATPAPPSDAIATIDAIEDYLSDDADDFGTVAPLRQGLANLRAFLVGGTHPEEHQPGVWIGGKWTPQISAATANTCEHGIPVSGQCPQCAAQPPTDLDALVAELRYCSETKIISRIEMNRIQAACASAATALSTTRAVPEATNAYWQVRHLIHEGWVKENEAGGDPVYWSDIDTPEDTLVTVQIPFYVAKSFWADDDCQPSTTRAETLRDVTTMIVTGFVEHPTEWSLETAHEIVCRIKAMIAEGE